MIVGERTPGRSAVANGSAGRFGTITVRRHDVGSTSVADERDQLRCRALDRTYSGPAIRHSPNTFRTTIVNQVLGDVQVDRRVVLEGRSGFWTARGRAGFVGRERAVF